jgi:uncharacterized protein YlaN (UPF0358 family)
MRTRSVEILKCENIEVSRSQREKNEKLRQDISLHSYEEKKLIEYRFHDLTAPVCPILKSVLLSSFGLDWDGCFSISTINFTFLTHFTSQGLTQILTV